MSSAQPVADRGLLREVYTGIFGSDLDQLFDSPNYPDNPDQVGYIDNFEAPTDVMEFYGQRVSGYIIAPQTGNYTFWIASDDESVLYLSTDDSPANRREIANVNNWTPSRQWTVEPNQQSEPVQLSQGSVYYVEALMKEGSGGDNLAVRWRLPSGDIQEPIPGDHLLPFGVSFTPPEIAVHPRDTTTFENESASFRVELSSVGPVVFQWQRNQVDIPGANSDVLVLSHVSLSEDGDQFRCVISNDQGSVNSESVALTVQPDTTPPAVVDALNIGDDRIRILFTERLDTSGAESLSNYQIDSGAEILDSTLSEDGTAVTLSTTLLESEATYTLTLNNLLDRAQTPNAIEDDTLVSVVVLDFVPVTIGEPSTEGRTESAAGGQNLIGAGGDIGGTTDEFYFNYQERIGDFDVQVRLAGLQNTDPWAKAGLMARSELEEDSAFAATLATPSISGVFFMDRSTPGGEAEREGSFPVNYPYTWLRLKRSGNTFTGYAGFDGRAWQELGQATISMPSTVYLGMAVASRDSTETAVAEFRGFNETQSAAALANLPPIEPMTASSRATGLTFSEIMYHPSEREDGKDLQFIELYNSLPVWEDLSGYRLSGNVDYTFPEGTVIPAGGYLVIAREPGSVASEYGQDNVLGPFEGNLDNSEGRLRLRNPIGAMYLQVEYLDDFPWPVAADGAGHSLALVRPSYGENNYKAWSASNRKGGSPGGPDPYQPDPLNAVVINEFLANTEEPAIDFIELYNHSNEPADLSGAFLSDSRSENKFRIPDGTVLEARGFLVFDQAQLGFNIDSEGEAVYFVNPSNTRVIDGFRFLAQENGISTGRMPDGAGTFHPLTTPTAGEPNADLYIHDVVINEIMYHPISGDVNDEYIELYNKGSADIDLSYWRFIKGIDYVFPPGTALPAGQHLTVARDAQHLIANYESLNASNTYGDYQAQLADGGEHIVLARPLDPEFPDRDFALVDEVLYRDGGRWGQWADADGSSLELIDPRSDNRQPSNWTDSDDTDKSEWVSFEHTGVLDHGRGTSDEVHAFLLGTGECLIDNIEISVSGGPNRVPNSTFESGVNGWVIQGNHVHSTLENSEGFQSNQSMRIVASGGGDNGANRVEANLSSSLSSGQTATIRGSARWMRGHTNLLVRLKGNYLEAVASLPVPNIGSPGLRNTAYASNTGPAIHGVQHRPVLPMANEPVVVTAQAQDPDGLSEIVLNYRRDPSSTRQTLDMKDDGTGGDAVAGDGVYSTTIPGQTSGALIAFYITAVDGHVEPASSEYPENGQEREALVRFGEPQPSGNFGTYRVWMTDANVEEWEDRVTLSNEGLDGTFVFGGHRVIYNATARYRGSPFIRPGYNSPVGGLCSYIVKLPKDDVFLGSRELNLDMLEQSQNRDNTLQRERMSFWIGDQLGVPFSNQQYVYLYFNGNRRGEVYTDSHQPNSDYIDVWFPDASDGEIFKIDDWFEFNDNVQREFNEDAQLRDYTTTGGEKKLARYRYSWEKKFNGGLTDDHDNLFSLVDALNNTGAPGTQSYHEAVAAEADYEQWARVFATRRIVADWDGYSFSRGKNQFMYRPVDGRWNMLLWDLDFSLGGGSRDASQGLFADINDPTIANRFYAHPAFRRAYLRAMYDALNGPLLSENMDPVMDALYQAFQDNDVDAASPSAIKSWVGNRRSTIRNELNSVDANFNITSNNGADFTVTDNLVMLEGAAPVEVKTILVNGVAYEARWDSLTDWTLDYALRPGENDLTVQGLDSSGNLLAGMEDAIQVNFQGEADQPEDHLMFSEIMYHSALPDADYVEIHNASESFSFDLNGYRLNGLDFVFPDGALILPGDYLIVAESASAFIEAYGVSAAIAGEYAGSLDNGGENLQLWAPPAEPNGPEALIDEVTYGDGWPWPGVADGTGPSLQLIDLEQPRWRAGNWGVDLADGSSAPERNLIPFDEAWRYSESPQSEGWQQPGFDDAAWQTGDGLFFAEDAVLDGPKSTPLNLGSTSYYFRKDFHLGVDESDLQSRLPVISEPGTGLDGEYWQLPTASILNILDQGGPQDIGLETIQNEPPDATFRSTMISYFGDDLTPIEQWLGPDGSSLSVSNPGNLDDGLIHLKGWLKITAPGTVQFDMPSDDGSVLWIEDQIVINNDGSHGAPGSPQGSFNFASSGLYPIEIAWFNGDWTDGAGNHGGASLELSSNGAGGLNDGLISAEFFYNASDVSELIAQQNDGEDRLLFPDVDPLSANLSLSTILDDGAVFYLNGVEFLRTRMPDGAIDAVTPADGTVGDAVLEGPFMIPSNLLRSGRNVLAAEVHQAAVDSSDVVFGLRLDLERETDQEPFTPGQANSIARQLPPFPDLWINEIQAVNQSTVFDSQGEADPWIELFNGGPTPLDLTMLSLSHDPASLDPWTFPEGAELNPGEHRIVWADGQPEQSTANEWHANFTLSNAAAGGTVVLYDHASGNPIAVHHLDYGSMQTDQSLGLYPDGNRHDLYFFIQPTPGSANSLEGPEAELNINEWMALNSTTLSNPFDGAFDDWFEIHNAGNVDVDLTGYSLSDDPADPMKYIIPPGYGVQANGYLLVWADDNTEANANGPSAGLHVNFRLSQDGESISLFAPNGDLADQVEFSAQTADVSEGRLPDGAPSPFVSFELPTPGASNEGTTAPNAPQFDPSLTRIEADGSFTLGFAAVPGAQYIIQYKNDLSDPAWTELTIVTADQATVTVTDTEAGNVENRFYRIVVAP